MPCTETPALYSQSATVTVARVLAPGYHYLALHAPEIARAARPGQFVMVRPAQAGAVDPLLGRPISLLEASAESGDIALIFKVVGRGTGLLATRQPGESLTVLGPLGNGFSIPDTAQAPALVGGGVGMPPLYLLAARSRRVGRRITLFYGGRSRDDLLLLPEWSALGVEVVLATDDGSAGQHGLVTAPLQARVGEFDFLAACGPKPMLRAVQQLALAARLPGQLSLEARMACGVGACLGCVCATGAGTKRVCVDGPVFMLEEVRFDG